MTPTRPLYLHRITREGLRGSPRNLYFLATDVTQAKRKFNQLYPDEIIEAVVLQTAGGIPVTELHCLKFGTLFQTVRRDNMSDDHVVTSAMMRKAYYTDVNHTYLCFDADGRKHYIDEHAWCITKEDLK